MPGDGTAPKRANPTPPSDEPAPAIPMILPRMSFATTLLLAFNVALWLMQVASKVPPLHPSSLALIAWGGNLPLFTLTGEAWRLFTAMLLHDGVAHLALNMLALSFTADRTEHEFGTLRMLAIYLAGGLVANCASVLWSEWRTTLADPTPLLTVSVGASGAIMAQFGALLVALVVVPPRFVDLPPDKRPGMDPGLVVVVALTLAQGFVVPHTDQSAHVGGLVGGMATGLFMSVRPEATGARAALVRYAATALLVAACIGALLHFAPHQRLQALRAAWAVQPALPR